MEVKIDTREKFHVITIKESILAANMTADMEKCLIPFLQTPVKNIVLNLQHVAQVDETFAASLVTLQQSFYEQMASFVVCCLQPKVEKWLDNQEMLEVMNVTPSESEAWDIVQMEEIEREFFDGEEKQ
ncbi:MAG: STAS domain-containing protein [Chitinophagaceae bacterium]|nr:STAS domain-containing protein [Chitinophagaceae bacterium]